MMKLRTDSMGDRIHAALLAELRRGAYPSDHRFVDTEVAAAFGASRMPAREALLRLAAEGYLVGTTRGFAIRALSLEEISELCELRRLLEPRAAASAAGHLTDEAAAALTAAIDTMRRGFAEGDMQALLTANVQFRDAWLSAVPNRRLAEATARLMDHFLPLRLDTFADDRHRDAYVEGMEGLHDAFLRRDALIAGDRMMRFMFDAEAAFLAARHAQLAFEEATAARPRRRAGGKERTLG